MFIKSRTTFSISHYSVFADLVDRENLEMSLITKLLLILAMGENFESSLGSNELLLRLLLRLRLLLLLLLLVVLLLSHYSEYCTM